MSIGPLDGPVPGRPRSVEGTISSHTPTPEALRDEALLHDANLPKPAGVPTWVWVLVAVVVVVPVLLLLLVLF